MRLRWTRARDLPAGLGDAPPGPVALLVAPDGWMAAATVRHLRARGAVAIAAWGPGAAAAAAAGAVEIGAADAPAALTRLIAALPGRWLLWLEAGEFLFYPFCETRALPALTGFLEEERRRALFCYTLDLYGPELPEDDPAARPLWFDAQGYHAFTREGGGLDLRGGLGWRFEELLGPPPQLGHPRLFRAAPGLAAGPGMALSDPALATVSGPWHHSPTGAATSLRTARRLLAHPGFAAVADRLVWPGSQPFDWTARPLLDAGMIEPGQWF